MKIYWLLLHSSLINLLYYCCSWFIHSFDLFNSTLEKVSIISITDIKKIAFIVTTFVESILSSFHLPIFSILQQNYHFILVIKCHPFNIRVNLQNDHLFTVINQVFYIQWIAALYCYDFTALFINSFSIKFNFLCFRTNAIQIPLENITHVWSWIKESFILIKCKSVRKLWIAEGFNLFSLIHVNDTCFSIFTGKTNVFFLER